ncbi:gamma-interferon-responsive lysosomal thiol protein-like isoform X2 [Oryza brachyantha]|uniref:gamma-interferon-responsive lysosomal thiol protein-like isoform X2 n=1 Tax=Oryza brachyantha TaxID=4533 RepID=UPI0003EAD106|nr:gamma-interferon-responsive lysosomal thiol protein-like isoform X2 [Oryza brachyantha]
MAALHHSRHVPFVAVLLLLLGASGAVEGKKGKVDVALYYESLCPFSATFVVDRLAKVFRDGLLDAIDLSLVPYGNARVRDGKISCQHGGDECLLNTVEACAIDAWPDLRVHFRFIYCVESLVVDGKRSEWESCFAKLNLDAKPVTDCYKSERGHQLSLKYGRQTDALQPPHKYVPWVVVDGQPLYEDYENFEAYVCKAYKGHPPKVCEGLARPPTPTVLELAEGGNRVSYYDSGDIRLKPDEDDHANIKKVLPDGDDDA